MAEVNVALQLLLLRGVLGTCPVHPYKRPVFSSTYLASNVPHQSAPAPAPAQSNFMLESVEYDTYRHLNSKWLPI
jgi:hypothetical protein